MAGVNLRLGLFAASRGGLASVSNNATLTKLAGGGGGALHILTLILPQGEIAGVGRGLFFFSPGVTRLRCEKLHMP